MTIGEATDTAQTADVLVNWRDHAISEALTAEAVSGCAQDALLREIRRFRPGCATLTTFYIDRLRLRRFLETYAAEFRSLLPGTDETRPSDGTEPASPYVAWWAAEWRQQTVEVVCIPTNDVNGSVIMISRDEQHVRAFAEEMLSYVNRPDGRCLRYAHGWESAPDIEQQVTSVTWDDVVLAPEMVAQVREAVEGFVRSKDAYAALGFAWRRGILLIGPPGTGKTMVCKAVANALPELPFLYVRDMSERPNQCGISAIFERAREVAPCILAFEDLDGLVHEGNRTTFLNELDGFKNNNGLLIVASSNHPGKIDEALLKRPSRFDRVFHIGPPAQEERAEFCRRILSRGALRERCAADLDVEALAVAVAERSEGFTPAYLKEALISGALLRVQNGAVVLDAAFAEAVLAQVDELRKHLKRMKDPDKLGDLSTGDGALGFRT